MKPFTAILVLVAIGTGAVAIVGGWMAWMQARVPFNSEGRFFDGLTVHYEQAVLAYAVIAALSALVAIACMGMAGRIAQLHRH